MPGVRKEELGSPSASARSDPASASTRFWYGADFPGETLSTQTVAPYGVPDRHHHAQCAAPRAEQRRRTLPAARARQVRQGFGRLMRRESDRGCVFVLDAACSPARTSCFLGELPLTSGPRPFARR
jgi:ATP-dependent DNA helicase DinG